MTDLVVTAAIVAVVALVATGVRRTRRVDAPTQREWVVPSQIDPDDVGTDRHEWTVIVFTSSSCHVCADVAAKARAVASRFVGVAEFEYERERALHDKYRIDAVPTLVITDARGVVRHHVLGPVSATDLWAAIAAVRETGRGPDVCAESNG